MTEDKYRYRFYATPGQRERLQRLGANYRYTRGRLESMQCRAHIAEAALEVERRKVAELEHRLVETIEKQINPPIILGPFEREQKEAAEKSARHWAHEEYERLIWRFYWWRGP